MVFEDSSELRKLLIQIYPNFIFESVAKKSGQRIVYFGHFDKKDNEVGLLKHGPSWGAVVLKVSQASNRAAIAYMEKEIEILRQINSAHYPRLFYNELVTQNPETEEPLKPALIVTIEERIDAVP